MTEDQSKPTYLPSGDTGLTVVLGARADRQTSERVSGLARAIDAAAIPGVIETVPTYLSLLVHYDPLATSQSDLIVSIEAVQNAAQATQPTPRRWTLPTCFDGPTYAPDLDHVADWAGMSPRQVIDDIHETEQFVYMIGFAPGQPYLGDLPERLAIPRRKVPVQGVPAGSLLIAVGKTVIYPNTNPTGWYIVGRTPVPMFNLQNDPPSLLRAGDHVRLDPVSAADFNRISDEIAAGDFRPVAETTQ